jgi:hypothetical protein
MNVACYIFYWTFLSLVKCFGLLDWTTHGPKIKEEVASLIRDNMRFHIIFLGFLPLRTQYVHTGFEYAHLVRGLRMFGTFSGIPLYKG